MCGFGLGERVLVLGSVMCVLLSWWCVLVLGGVVCVFVLGGSLVCVCVCFRRV